MRTPDHFDADGYKHMGCCPCCHIDLDAPENAHIEIVSYADGSFWCAPCEHGECDCNAGLDAEWPTPSFTMMVRTEKITHIVLGLAAILLLWAGEPVTFAFVMVIWAVIWFSTQGGTPHEADDQR